MEPSFLTHIITIWKQSTILIIFVDVVVVVCDVVKLFIRCHYDGTPSTCATLFPPLSQLAFFEDRSRPCSDGFSAVFICLFFIHVSKRYCVFKSNHRWNYRDLKRRSVVLQHHQIIFLCSVWCLINYILFCGEKNKNKRNKSFDRLLGAHVILPIWAKHSLVESEFHLTRNQTQSPNSLKITSQCRYPLFPSTHIKIMKFYAKFCSLAAIYGIDRVKFSLY